MKKKFLTLFFLAVVMATTTFAAGIKENVNQTVLTSFNQRFAQATDITWSKSEDFLKATFKLNGQPLFAYFSAGGELMGVCRNIVTTQLPLNLQTELQKKFSTSWVSELFELTTENETTYFITVESADALVTLKGTGSVSWTIYNKSRKN